MGNVAKRVSTSTPARGVGDETGSISFLYETDRFVIATWKGIGIHIWARQGTPPLVQKVDEYNTEFLKLHPRGIASLHVITKNAPPPDENTRILFKKLTKKFSKDLSCICNVVEGSGFWAGALHAFLTGLHWISRESHDYLICATVPEASAWVAETHSKWVGEPVAADELEEAVKKVRQRIE